MRVSVGTPWTPKLGSSGSRMLQEYRTLPQTMPASSWLAPALCAHHSEGPSCFQRGWWAHWDRNAWLPESIFLGCFLKEVKCGLTWGYIQVYLEESLRVLIKLWRNYSRSKPLPLSTESLAFLSPTKEHSSSGVGAKVRLWRSRGSRIQGASTMVPPAPQRKLPTGHPCHCWRGDSDHSLQKGSLFWSQGWPRAHMFSLYLAHGP